MKCKSIEEYRQAINDALKDKWGGDTTAYCEYSGVPYSTLRKFLRGDIDTLMLRYMRLIEIDLGISLATSPEKMFSLSNGGFGMKFYTNSAPNVLITQVDWSRLYRIAKQNKDRGLGTAIIKLNTAIEVEEFNCAATLYMNVGECR